MNTNTNLNLNTKISVYGREMTIREILQQLNEYEINEIFSEVLESLLQEGRI